MAKSLCAYTPDGSLRSSASTRLTASNISVKSILEIARRLPNAFAVETALRRFIRVFAAQHSVSGMLAAVFDPALDRPQASSSS